MATVAFEIVETATDKVIGRVPVSAAHSENDRALERIEMGIMRQVDLEHNFVREVTE